VSKKQKARATLSLRYLKLGAVVALQAISVRSFIRPDLKPRAATAALQTRDLYTDASGFTSIHAEGRRGRVTSAETEHVNATLRKATQAARGDYDEARKA
jgi:hypothetical protein